MLQRRSLGVRLGRRFRRFVRRSRPVRFGQTPAGLAVAAALILLWGLERPVAAAPLTPTGSAENQYFVLEWNYDLPAGIGSLTIKPKSLVPSPGSLLEPVCLYSPRFVTHGGILVSEPDSRYYLYGDTVGEENGIVDLEYAIREHRDYNYSNWIGLSGIASMGFHFFGREFASSAIGPTLPVRLTTTQMICTPAVYDSQRDDLVWFPESSLEFVTVEAVPEPGTLALTGLGAAAASAVARRRRSSDEDGEAAR